MTSGTDERALQAVAARALDLIGDGARVGLGSGRAAATFIAQLGERVRQGLRVAGVPTSEASGRLARALGIPLIELDEEVELDLTVDGADEVTPALDLVKGRGGALVRERIVASASKRQVILVGRDKLVGALGERGPIPVEVIPLARGPVTRRLRALGLRVTLRASADGTRPLLTDNGNLTLDCAPPAPLNVNMIVPAWKQGASDRDGPPAPVRCALPASIASHPVHPASVKGLPPLPVMITW